MMDVMISSDPTKPVPSDWQFNSTELYSAAPEQSKEGSREVRDLHIKLENLLKSSDLGSSGGGAQGINDVVHVMLRVDVAMQERYMKLDLPDLLKKNKIIKGKDGLLLLSAALGILEKYGRNLLKSNRPSQWKTISFSNAVFRTRVDIIKGARDILKLLGYTEVVEDGVCFPDSVQSPNNSTVAIVTADLILAKAEIEAYSKHSHLHPERVKECLEGTIAAIYYPPSDASDPNRDGNTVYVRQSNARHDSNPQHNEQQNAPSSEKLQRPGVFRGQPVFPLSQPVVRHSQPVEHPTQASTLTAEPMKSPKAPPVSPKPAWMQTTSRSVTVPPTTLPNISSSGNDHLICTICGQDSATKECDTCPERHRCDQCDTQWHRHPSRKLHHRRDIYPIIYAPTSAAQEESSALVAMCSVCGGTRATQHCQECDHDFCDPCGKKMHLHPKRRSHKLQLLPGSEGEASHRQPPDGISNRPATEEPQEERKPAGVFNFAISRPDSYNNQHMSATYDLNNQQSSVGQSPNNQQSLIGQSPNNQQSPIGQIPNKQRSSMEHQRSPVNQQLSPQPNLQKQYAPMNQTSPGQEPVRKKPVPKPRMRLGNSPTSPVPPGEFGRPVNTAFLSTVGGPQQEVVTTPLSPTPKDPREIETQNIMSQDVDLLEKITSIRKNLKSLPHDTQQHASLVKMEESLWTEHLELIQRQAELEQSFKEPPIKTTLSTMVDIRRPPVAEKPSVNNRPTSGSYRPSTSPASRPEIVRSPQDSMYPSPQKEWECITCGYINNKDKHICESCNKPYSAPSMENQLQQGHTRRPTALSQNQPVPSHHIQGPDASQAPSDVRSPAHVTNIISSYDVGQTSRESQVTQMVSPPPSPLKTVSEQAKLLETQLPGGLPFGAKMPAAKPTVWRCKQCTIINREGTVCSMCGGQQVLDVPFPTTSRSPIQRQQTEGEKPLDDRCLTAYEYMQLQEQEMLKEKQKAKAEDNAQQKMASESKKSTDNTPKHRKTLPEVPAGMPPVKVIRNGKLQPLTAAIGTLENNKIKLDSPGKDNAGDAISSSLSPTSHIQLTQERIILGDQATEGLAFVNILRQAETNNFCVEDVVVASWAIQETQSDGDIVQWLQQNWDDYKSTATAQATNALNRLGCQERIQLSEHEVVEALYKHDGQMEEVVNECVQQRNEKIAELESYGFDTSQAAKAISMCNGNIDKALTRLQQAVISPMLERVWESDNEDTQLLQWLKVKSANEGQRERYLRVLFAEFNISSWGRAITAAKLIQVGKYNTCDAITAASECGDYERAKQFLEKECNVCYGEFPHNQLMSLSHCKDCLICSECLVGHFKTVIDTRNIIHATCPACSKPDSKDTTELSEYFTFLDTWLRGLLDEETHALFLRKLRDWNLQKEDNFRWCAHCRNGFINEAPERRKMRCPECAKITCFDCKKPWMEQHEMITCQQFEQWKQLNDPEKQAEGVAYHLKENGIECPQCKMRYELAKGGCMHFKCTQCMFEFCCGCNKPFLNGAECAKFPSCGNKGLHSHHPRDCLFYLRDWDVPPLQKLIDNHNISYDTKPLQGLEVQKQGGCRVMEQKETPEGLNDGPCGRDTPANHAGLCSVSKHVIVGISCAVPMYLSMSGEVVIKYIRIHYLEYLVGLINQNMIDPAETYDPVELTTVLNRNEIPLPGRQAEEAEQMYKQRLLQMVQEKLPFGDKPPRERP